MAFSVNDRILFYHDLMIWSLDYLVFQIQAFWNRLVFLVDLCYHDAGKRHCSFLCTVFVPMVDVDDWLNKGPDP